MSGIKTANLNAQQAQQILSDVQKRLQVSLQSPSRLLPGQPLLASVIPNIPEIDASELVNGIINLAWLEKDVLFKDVNAIDLPSPDSTIDASDLEGDEIVKALESDPTNVIKQPFPLPPLSTNSVLQTPGLAAQLAGTITLPKLAVSVRTEWIVRKWNKAHTDQIEQKDGTDLIALNGLTNPSVSILLPPVFRELRADTIANPGGVIFCLSAKITLSIGSVTHSFTLGPIPVLQLPVLVPTVVALFSEPNFNVDESSAVVVWVPQHSLLSSAAPLFNTLKKIETVLEALGSIASIAGFLLGVRELSSLTDHPKLRFINADRIAKLSAIRLKRKPWYDFFGSDETFNDQTSSLLIFGLPGTRVHFYNAYDFKKTHGYYKIKLKDVVELTPAELQVTPLPDHFVAIRDFVIDSVTSPPKTFPANRIVETEDDPNADNQWDNVLSSVEFDRTWLSEISDDIRHPQIIETLSCSRSRRDPRTEAS